MVTKIGLDLGYANITLSDVTCEIYREPSIALIQKEARSDRSRIIAVGNDAMSYTPEEGTAPLGVMVRPFKNGILFDHQLTEEIIHKAIGALGETDRIRCVIGVPADFLPKQEKELFAMLAGAGVDSALSVSRSVAALIGAGYSPNISVISVNIGALSTEMSVLHKGKIILSNRAEIGGEDFDKAVKQFVLDQGDVNISLSVARAIKERLGAVWKGKPNDSIDIDGTLALTGNKLRMNITTEDIVGVFEDPIQRLILAIIEIVKGIPAEAVEDVFESGIILTGGGAELYGIDMLLEKVLGISVTKPTDAIDCVAKGLSRVNGFIPPRFKGQNKNITAQLADMYEQSKTKM